MMLVKEKSVCTFSIMAL